MVFHIATLAEMGSDFPWWVQVLGGILTLVTGGAFTKWVDLKKRRVELKAKEDNNVWKLLGRLEAKVEYLERKLNRQFQNLHEKRKLIYARNLNIVELRIEVNEELRKQNQPPRYDKPYDKDLNTPELDALDEEEDDLDKDLEIQRKKE